MKDCQTALKASAALITKTKKGAAPFVPLEKVDNFLRNLDIFVGKVGFVVVTFWKSLEKTDRADSENTEIP